MSYQLIFHPHATAEYTEAYQWYEQEQKGLGNRFEKKVEACLQQIKEYPGKLEPDIHIKAGKVKNNELHLSASPPYSSGL